MRMGRDAELAVVSAAHLALSQWTARIGAAGMAAMHAIPGLLAEVDQHAADVRDAISQRCGQVLRVHLAAYADGVADRATARGWSPREVAEGQWLEASWPSVRLLAVCVLAAEVPA